MSRLSFGDKSPVWIWKTTIPWLLVFGGIIFVNCHHDGEGGKQHYQSATGFSKARRITGRVLREVMADRDPNVVADPMSVFPQVHRTWRHVPVENSAHPNWRDGHLEKLRLELPLNESDPMHHTVLHLTLNRGLLSSGYFEKFQKSGNYVVNVPSYEEAELCHYQGVVEGRPTSQVAISTCHGGIRGVIFDEDELHHLEPVVADNKLQPGSSHSWDMIHYKGIDFRGRLSPVYATLNPSTSPKNVSTSPSRIKRLASASSKSNFPPGNPRYVELVMVVDFATHRHLGGDEKASVQRCKDVVNIVNALYKPFNIYVALVGVVVWNEKDEIPISPDGDETLSQFLLYRREHLVKDHPNDNVQLLTGVELQDGQIGKAMLSTMCTYKYSGGVSSDRGINLVGTVATRVAHMIGHNFGLSHDQKDCDCPAEDEKCIMDPSASPISTSHWSSCSIMEMANAFEHGIDHCLRNKPTSLYNGPTCGNGVTEPGEECDCGLPEYCDNPCCEASTCLFAENATCASGSCCDTLTCSVKTGGTPCRKTNGRCDLPEFCTGTSEFCPEDVKILDGLECETPNGKAFCYSGECRTHTDQCKLLWGPSGNKSSDLCYQRNSNGSRLAHCGNSKCGILHCLMDTDRLEYSYESAAILASFFVNAGGRIYPCRSVIVDVGLSDISPGMVPDGASCGPGKMCVSQKCVESKVVMGVLGDLCGGGDCSGHGVCDSNGLCHCDDGYEGTLCEEGGHPT
ncbi:disintegrin and metalloproteinase domain-containing protein 12 isoform X2 [Folsomia candida]|uniref:disintegrin and metalloproteinase domain-containing protein 12 isoform X2 n=1 Tax=Folsomia candida TaxID=158441 RepID=UPI001604A42C|nr:disintegrin and metalloproteinase domain-containing protein 12 isoform X2 [Folsomia candida]